MRSRVQLYQEFKAYVTRCNADCSITFSTPKDHRLTLVATAIVVWRTVVMEYTLFEDGEIYLNSMRSTNKFDRPSMVI